MMRDGDKPFICYKSKSSIKIVPRNMAGWRATALWTLLMIVLVVAFIAAIGRAQSDVAVTGSIIGFIALMTVWALGLFRWTKARSEIVDMDELLAIKRERDRKA